MMRRSKWAGWTLATFLPILVSGCLTVGRDFPSEPVPSLEVGRTTRQEVEQAFGRPWRTGLEDGQRTWTYGVYRYSLFWPTRARDLVLRFDEQGVLTSYQYDSTEQELD